MSEPSWQLCCPVSISDDADRILLAHGEGGRLMRRLIEERIIPRVSQESGSEVGDAAILPSIDGPLALTTDSFVVSPLFFPGGDIGRLAVFGTVNDLAVAGAEPLWISLGLIIEEGLPMVVLEWILDSIATAAREADVKVVAGDTKVVPRDAADGLFINTSGVGRVSQCAPVGPTSIEVGDRLIVTGPVGRHGIAILAAREQLGFVPPPETDCASLIEPSRLLMSRGPQNHGEPLVRAMRDATRGGVTAVLHEWAQACGHTLTIDEQAVPVSAEVRGAAELLGLDPLYIANEGTMLVAVKPEHASEVFSCLRETEIAREAAVIGEVCERKLAPVTVRRSLGNEQPLDEPSGAMLPRIC